MGNRDETFDFLIHVAAMLKTGQLQGVTVTMLDHSGTPLSKCYAAPGASKFVMLADQVRMLDP